MHFTEFYLTGIHCIHIKVYVNETSQPFLDHAFYIKIWTLRKVGGVQFALTQPNNTLVKFQSQADTDSVQSPKKCHLSKTYDV